jgi:hypothetical protein
MYSEEFENLINLALVDGELTEKEKQILFKKAEAAGIDFDEFEMVLEAKLFEKQQSNKKIQVPFSAAPKSDKFGDIKKCPACGAMIQSFSTKCSDCGHDFINIENANSIKDFFRDYQKIEDSVQVKENKSMGGLVGGLMGAFDNSEGRRKLAVFTKKKEFIMHFPIPNSKEDLLEFLTMAVPLATPAKKSGFSVFKKFSANWGDDEHKNYDFKVAEVWMQKCEQILMKAKLSMKDDKKTLEEIMAYANELGIK